jgi:formylglycine-generating enzyme required for sulfatase activity
MGSDSGHDDEQPVHTVTLIDYYMDVYEVTNAHYVACVDAGGCTPPYGTSSFTHSNYYRNIVYMNYPVIYVHWNQAKTYCEWRGARLPTEAEWEKAARGTDGSTYPWGNTTPSKSLVNYNDSIGDTAEVGSYESGKSPYGMYDMAGNVWEWVNDWYDFDYYRSSPTDNPQGPSSGNYRVLRGGAWSSPVHKYEDFLSSARRDGFDPDLGNYDLGFRCSRDANP